MNLCLVTDNSSPWLEYVWAQFLKMNGYGGDSAVLGYDAPVSNGSAIVEYADTRRLSSALYIPRVNEYRSNELDWIDGELPVYRATIKGGKCDLLYNAFVRLSRLEEYEATLADKPTWSYAAKHPARDSRVWKLPVVNMLFNRLERMIRERYPAVVFADTQKPIVTFSHDVDYLTKTPQLRLKGGAFYMYNFVRTLIALKAGAAFSSLFKGMAFALCPADYWCFDKWARLEEELRIRSVYYFYAKPTSRRGGLKAWLLEPSYDLSSNERLGDTIKRLRDAGNLVGLHGSFHSARDAELFAAEKSILERAMGSEVTRVRQHWLSFDEGATPRMHEQSGIQEDSTIGFNDLSGFRAGVASIYNPYDHERQRAFDLEELPLVVMDSHLYDYSYGSEPDDLKWFVRSMNEVKKFAVSVDWHQRVISPDYGWVDGFKKLAEIAQQGRG